MMDNLMIETRILDDCDKRYEICIKDSVVNQASLIICILVNIFPMIILSRIRELKATAYGILLHHMTFTDILSSTTLYMINVCEFRQWLHWTDFIFGLAARAALNLPNTMRYLVLILTMYEKYLAICDSFHYNEHILVRKPNLTCFVLHITSLGFSALTTWLGLSYLCLHETGALSGTPPDNLEGVILVLALGSVMCVHVLSYHPRAFGERVNKDATTNSSKRYSSIPGNCLHCINSSSLFHCTYTILCEVWFGISSS